MRLKESNKLDQKLFDKIIRVAYGDAGIIDRIYVNLKASSNQKIKELLEEYKHTADAVHHVKQENVPDQIIKLVTNRTAKEKHKSSLLSGLSYIVFLIFGRKTIPAIALAIIFVIIVSFILLRNETPTHKYSKAEIELAEKQFRESIAVHSIKLIHFLGSNIENFKNEISNSVLGKNSTITSTDFFNLGSTALGGVSNLVNEVKPAGSYSITFNSANLTSGVYFYKIEAGNFIQTRKMILLK